MTQAGCHVDLGWIHRAVSTHLRRARVAGGRVHIDALWLKRLRLDAVR